MIKHLIVLLCIIMSLSSCESQPEHIVIAHKMMNEFSQRVYYSDGLVVWGTGGSMRGGINQLILSFVSNRNLNVESARRLYLQTVLKLIDFVNNTPQAQPFLRNHPFGWDNSDVNILFFDKNSNYVTNNKVAAIFVVKGKIFYEYFNPSTGHLDDLHVETIEEALCIFYGAENNSTSNNIRTFE